MCWHLLIALISFTVNFVAGCPNLLCRFLSELHKVCVCFGRKDFFSTAEMVVTPVPDSYKSVTAVCCQSCVPCLSACTFEDVIDLADLIMFFANKPVR